MLCLRFTRVGCLASWFGYLVVVLLFSVCFSFALGGLFVAAFMILLVCTDCDLVACCTFAVVC